MAIILLIGGLFLGNWLFTAFFVEEPIHLFQGLQSILNWGISLLGLAVFAWFFGEEDH